MTWKRSPRRSTFATVRTIAAGLPGVEEGTSYHTPALRIRKRFFARLREDGDSLVVKVGDDDRDLLLGADPEVFYVTDHYRGHPVVLIRLSRIRPTALRDILTRAYHRLG